MGKDHSSLSGKEPSEGQANILLVDDHPANLLALEVILEDPGHNLVKARSGEEALRLLQDQDFAAVLLDVRMQGLDGFETAKLIRGRERSRHTPIIFLTAHDENRLPVVEAYGLGAVDYLTKPVVPVILRAKVAGFLELFRKTEQVKRQAEQLRQVERREFERKLADENARFRALTEHSSDAVSLVSATGIVEYTTPSSRRVLGYEPDAFVGRSGLEIVHPDDQERIRGRLVELVQEPGRPLTVEVRVLHADGSWRWVECVGTNLLGEPAVRAIVVNFRDITERHLATAALRESEQEFRTLADSIPQLAWMARPDGSIFWYNRRWYEYTGMTAEQLEGWEWETVHDPGELPRVLRSWKAALVAGEPWEDTFPLRRHDGQMRWHLSRAVPVRNDQGRVLRWFGTNTDITDRRQMEEALKEADRRKDEFLAMLAHELRNPLAPIRNAVQVFRLRGLPDADLQQARDMIDRQVEHLTRLVDDLLDVSRITRGKITLRKEPMELATVITRAVETSRPLIEANRHTLKLSLPAETIPVVADSTRLEQVFANLLNNAAKYTERGGHIWLTIALGNCGSPPQGERSASGASAAGTAGPDPSAVHAPLADHPQVEVRVRDTGFGIPAQILPHVFDLFTQADRTLDRAQGGLGIGLTLVKALVEMHGGSVAAQSEGPGKGSEFVVRLPVHREALDPPRVRDSGDQAPSPGDAPGARILVVDDNRDAADSLAILLRIWGHQVRTSHDGLSGLKAACSYRPQIVLLDLGLPGLDGYEVARRLRKEFGREMWLVALTGYGQEEDRRRSQEAGFDRHLVKPVDLDTLQELVNTTKTAAENRQGQARTPGADSRNDDGQ